MASRKAAQDTIEKAQVTVQPPGVGPRFALLGNKNVVNDIALYEKKGQYGIFYEMYRQHPVVRAAIDRKSNFASAGGFTYVTADKSVRSEVPAEKEQELRRFFKASNFKKLLRHTYKDLDIYGESFWVIVTNLNDRPLKAMRLNPRYVNPVIVNGEVVSWKYGPVMQDDRTITYPDRFVIHFAIEDPESDVTGLSPLYALQRAVSQDIFAMEYNESFFKNAAQTGTIFIAKTADANEAKRAREWIEANYTGPQNAHRPLFIEGDVSVEKSVSTRQEMEFLEGRKLLRQEIAMVLGVDLDKLGIHDSSNRAISKEQEDAFHTESIWPRQVLVEEEINFKLISELYGWDDVLVTHTEADLRRKREQVDMWDSHQKMGRMSINDILEEMGRPPLPNGLGDEYMLSTPAGTLTVRAVIEASARGEVAEPISGVGTDTFGKRNPPSASDRTILSPNQAEESKMGDR